MSNRIFTELNTKIFLELTEGEAGALDAICGYGPQVFKEWFYRNLGKHYLQKYEKHIDSLFEKARSLDYDVKRIQKIREELKKIEQDILNPKPKPLQP